MPPKVIQPFKSDHLKGEEGGLAPADRYQSESRLLKAAAATSTG